VHPSGGQRHAVDVLEALFVGTQVEVLVDTRATTSVLAGETSSRSTTAGWVGLPGGETSTAASMT
jgi:hypothetical protein